MQLLLHQSDDEDDLADAGTTPPPPPSIRINRPADAAHALSRALSAVNDAMLNAVLMPIFDSIDWMQTAVACVRNLVIVCGDNVICAGNWQLLAPGGLVKIPGLEFDEDLLATSNGKRLVLRDFFCVQSVCSPTEVLTAASRANFNFKMRAKTRGETIAAAALLPYCVLSGPTQLTFVNKRKSSAFRKVMPPPMFHRFKDVGFGFFADVVREYSGMAQQTDDDGGGSRSSSALPLPLPPLGLLDSIRCWMRSVWVSRASGIWGGGCGQLR